MKAIFHILLKQQKMKRYDNTARVLCKRGVTHGSDNTYNFLGVGNWFKAVYCWTWNIAFKQLRMCLENRCNPVEQTFPTFQCTKVETRVVLDWGCIGRNCNANTS